MPGSTPFTLDDLRRILRDGAGTSENVNLAGDILDTAFADLGYDSLALLETGSRIAREFAVGLDDELLVGDTRPREVIDAVNTQLAAGSPT
ncbi:MULTISPECIES: acyl carrier protein [unclassified Micromonospora]|uniref:acyl carrier protein n=1 Tax=unclassified Micromonospora TaxID=2617518 RepID=UPI00343896B8